MFFVPEASTIPFLPVVELQGGQEVSPAPESPASVRPAAFLWEQL